MKVLLFLLSSCQISLILAQSFSAIQNTPFTGVGASAIAFSDIDGDDDQDLLLSGRDSANHRIAKLYLNDGTGTFTELTNTPFIGVVSGTVHFADVNGDKAPDLFITGLNSSNLPSANLYLNDGTGRFQLSDAVFTSVESSAVAIGDLDGDLDNDLFLTGTNSSGNRIAKWYANDGSGQFSEVTTTTFEGVSMGAVALADVDKDDDLDLFLSGNNNAFVDVATLYLNNGQGVFTADGTFFDRLGSPALVFFDVDTDQDPDLLLTGLGVSPEAILYKNNEMGRWEPIFQSERLGVVQSAIAFADVDGDQDQDLFVTGTDGGVQKVSMLHLNDGSGRFTVSTDSSFEPVNSGAVAFADVDGDLDQDLLITGFDRSNHPISILYRNNSTTTSTTEQEPALRFTLSPNPVASDQLHIHYRPIGKGPISVSVFSQTGQLMSRSPYSARANEAIFVLHTTHLPPGNYFIQLQEGDRSASQWLLID